MKTHLPAREASHRPSTITLISAALVLALLTPQGVAAQNRRAQNTSRAQTSKRAGGSKGAATLLWTAKDVEIRSHIPPIIIGDGSLSIYTTSYAAGEHSSSGNTDRPHKYRKGHGRAMTRVAVINIAHTGESFSVLDYFPATGVSEVRIHLQKEAAGGGYEPVRPGKPQIIIRGSQEIEIDHRTLDPDKCEKNVDSERDCRFQHRPTDYSNFRIGEVWIRKPGAQPYMLDKYVDSDRAQMIIRIHYNIPH
jgi:hypothetical protein